MKMLQRNPCKIMSQAFFLPMEIQEIMVMVYFNDQKSEAWMLRFNEFKVTIEIETKEIWRKLEYEMSLIHLFCIHWSYLET